MLPEALSNEICSLKPGVDRLSMTVDVYFTEKLSFVAYEIYPAVIRSNLRLTYAEALALLDGTALKHYVCGSVDSNAVDMAKPRLQMALQISKACAAKRASTGGIDFDTVEAKVELNAEGAPVGINIRRRTDATALIEEAMILANEIVATHLLMHDLPCAFRNHERPQSDTVAGLVAVFGEFGWFSNDLAADLLVCKPFAFQEIIARAKGRPEEQLVTSLVLRSMMRAAYSPENLGHFGLGLSAYCHFTSPIRRYPDLCVHRELKRQLSGKHAISKRIQNELKFACEHSSKMERVAEAASRQSQELMIAEYMQQFVGQSFSGVISGTTSSGVYVALENTAEGFLPIKALGSEYFIFDYKKHQLRGSDTGKTFRLGQRVAVVLESVDTQASSLEFSLAKQKTKRKRAPKGAAHKAASASDKHKPVRTKKAKHSK
jgi:ribonuclease R